MNTLNVYMLDDRGSNGENLKGTFPKLNKRIHIFIMYIIKNTIFILGIQLL